MAGKMHMLTVVCFILWEIIGLANVNGVCLWCCSKSCNKGKRSVRDAELVNSIKELYQRSDSKTYLCDFNYYDLNTDGVVLKEEYMKLLSKSGSVSSLIGFNLIDANEDNRVTPEEFRDGISLFQQTNAMQRCKQGDEMESEDVY